ncbi:phosphate transport system permease protein PstA [Luteitalea sp. TBR-22]|uniref:phosphate ABC transporter permease PstA n=1 Tax=Luteitalea sp. TBR-22 TaxID=2802971 RepID=UPI001AF0914C|nr:phosphate ABC transporter permease PstA [Luteitalea sp. TBR-22]BCS32912.1 phosphate transport system permease protein PstA [Luteitalea sp. TBR-22]
MTGAAGHDRGFHALGLAVLALALLGLGLLLWDVARDGAGRLSWAFLTGFPSRRAASAGLLPALAGSVWIVVLAAAMAVPIGLGAAIALEEYGGRGRGWRLIEINLATLAGVPSIIYGLLGLGVFVRALGMERTVLSGAATLALLMLPLVIITARESLRAVPRDLREGSLALGATKWQTIWHQVLPAALPGVLTGVILAVARVIGEAAPLIVVGALSYVPFVPDGPRSPFTALPVQIFAWVSRPGAGFRTNAAAAILVLLFVLLVLNGLAIWVRDRSNRRRTA